MSGLLIVGAGPAGLGLAAACAGRSQIIEQEAEIGGLCRSFEFGGCVFDIGGHSFHTPHAEVAAQVESLMQGRWETRRRDARVWFGGQMIDYPFQQHFDQIADAAIVAECQREAPGVQGASFEDWICGRFGPGIARHFMLPYNRKLWARDLGQMSAEWVGERIAGSGANSGRAPLETASAVGYPANGGFVEIYRALAERAGPIALGERLVAVDIGDRTARTAAGNVYRWNRLVSTMPLPALLRCLSDCPAELMRDADALEAVSLKVVMIAAERSPGQRPQRLYVADPAAPAHKIAFNHESSAALRRRPREAVMCEVSYSPFKVVPDDRELERTMLGWLREQGLIGDGPAEVRTLDVPLAYPVPTPTRSAIVARIRAWLEPRGIFTIGRFGGWRYANSDACIQEAQALADRLANRDGWPAIA